MADMFFASARRHHPEATLYLCLADMPVDDPSFYPSGCIVVPGHTLDIVNFAEFAFRYDIMEFNTALKPFMFRHLLSKGHPSVLYFDPDIEIFRPLDSVMELLDGGASLVLTPHLCKPSEGDDYPGDIGIMQSGVFNLGFLGVGNVPEAETVLRWWSRRLRYQCINNQPGGVFVDQTFMDLVPGFAQNARILRDPTMNVAYWNLSQRSLTREGDSWQVDGQPLGFFHYSGFDPRNLSRLSKYTQGFQGSQISPDLQILIRNYSERLLASQQGTGPVAPYAYGRFQSGTVVTELVRRVFREDHFSWAGNPFETYEDYLKLPAIPPWQGPAGACVTHLLSALRNREPWLKETFDPANPDSARNYIDWVIKHAEPLIGDSRLIELISERFGDLSTPRCRPPRKKGNSAPDVDVIGYLRLALGLGEAGRLTLRSLVRTGLKVRGLETSLNSSSSRNDTSCESLLVEKSTAPVQVFNINADQLGQVIEHFGPALRSDSYRILIPFWELSNLPDAWVNAFQHVDEVWAPTRFIQTMLMRKINKPVIRMPLCLEFEPPAPVERSRFNLPADKALFFFAFDFFSFQERKNPLAVVEAFRRAFRQKGQATPAALVLKTLNSEIVPEQGQALRDSLRDDPDILLIEQTLSREDTLALIGCCDCVVSLHRSEGLGLLIAEAMVLGKPVISTDYSGTTDLVSPETGYPVDYKLIPVKEGDYPFHEGQRWADADLDHAAWQMRQVFNGTSVARKVAAAKAHIHQEFGQDAVSRRQLDRLRIIGAGP